MLFRGGGGHLEKIVTKVQEPPEIGYFKLINFREIILTCANLTIHKIRRLREDKLSRIPVLRNFSKTNFREWSIKDFEHYRVQTNLEKLEKKKAFFENSGKTWKTQGKKLKKVELFSGSFQLIRNEELPYLA